MSIFKNIATTSLLSLIFIAPISSSDYPRPETLGHFLSRTMPAFNQDKVHKQLYVFLDPNEWDGIGGALAYELNALINIKEIPVILSQTLVRNYIIYLKRSGEEKKLINNWFVYDVPNTQFYIFIPKNKLSEYKQSFALHSLEQQQVNNSEDLDKIANSIPWDTPELRKSDFQKIFIKNENEVWDVSICGHGGIAQEENGFEGAISGITPPKSFINEVLTFFNQDINTGVMYILTCSVGGRNLAYFLYDENERTNYNFILIVGSVSDTVAFVELNPEKFIKDFYYYAENLRGKGKDLNDLLNAINSLWRHAGTIHGANNIPQVLLPDGLGFLVFNINKWVLSVGPVLYRVHQLEKKSIDVEDRQVVLWYPSAVEVPVKVFPKDLQLQSEPALQGELELRKYQWKKFPTTTELLGRDNSYFTASKNNNVKNGGNLEDFIKANLEYFPTYKELLEEDKINKQVISRGISYLYAQFISKVHTNIVQPYGDEGTGTSILHFKEITARHDKEHNTPFLGVLKFIRDSFLGLNFRETEEIYLIDELNGYNDISLILETIRASTRTLAQTDLEKTLQTKANQNISLKNVCLKTSGDYWTGAKVELEFELDGIRWELDSKSSRIAWNFTKSTSQKSKYDDYLEKAEEAAHINQLNIPQEDTKVVPSS